MRNGWSYPICILLRRTHIRASVPAYSGFDDTFLAPGCLYRPLPRLPPRLRIRFQFHSEVNSRSQIYAYACCCCALVVPAGHRASPYKKRMCSPYKKSSSASCATRSTQCTPRERGVRTLVLRVTTRPQAHKAVATSCCRNAARTLLVFNAFLYQRVTSRNLILS